MATIAKRDRRLREERLGFRVDEPTKALIERAHLWMRRVHRAIAQMTRMCARS